MNYQTELDFFKKILQNFRLPYHTITYPFNDVPDLDLGLRKLLDPDTPFSQLLTFNPSDFAPNTIYHIFDKFNCNYFFFQLPECDVPTYFFVGPYLRAPISNADTYAHIERFNIPPGLMRQVENYYYSLPLLPDASGILSITTTLGEKLWGSVENFSFQTIEQSKMSDAEYETLISLYHETDYPPFSVKLLEERYDSENEFLRAVSQGQFLKAEKLLKPYAFTNLEPRTAEPLRNHKNYMIILNTLLRKAAEYGSVHPYHIDSLSSKFGRKIELTSSVKEIEQLRKEMVHKYCLLVQNHSMKGYSLLIRKVLTQIDTDLTANLSLNTLATALNVNSSYLSTLFKKEVGMTLTEFVNRKRIEHALLLLNSTSMQIQTIAQHSGISDVNYFTKLFKKQLGMTPKEYRESLYPQK